MFLYIQNLLFRVNESVFYQYKKTGNKCFIVGLHAHYFLTVNHEDNKNVQINVGFISIGTITNTNG